jgi:hypothetical protein
MSIVDLCERIQETWLSQAISQSVWGYPIVGGLHVLAIALFGGSVLATDLRALGLAFRRHDLRELARDVLPWKCIGLALVILTGLLLFLSRAVQYYESTSFRIKMVLLVLILLNAVEARRRREAGTQPGAVAMHAAISMLFWVAVLFTARGIAFF